MPAATSLAGLFDDQWAGWRQTVLLCLVQPTRRQIHELRVRSRRLLALLALVQEVVDPPRKASGRVQQAVAAVMDCLSPLRDAQNQRHRVARTRPGTGLDGLRHRLERDERRLRRRARQALEAAGAPRVLEAALRLRDAIASPRRAPRRGARALRIANAVDAAAAGVRERLARLDAAEPRTAHKLRIALKRLRDTVEVAERLSPALQVSGQATVRALQRRLGTAHDAEIMLELLERDLRRHGDSAGAGLDALRTSLEAQRHRLMSGLPRALRPLSRVLAG